MKDFQLETLNINLDAIEKFQSHLEENEDIHAAAEVANVAHQSNNISN